MNSCCVDNQCRWLKRESPLRLLLLNARLQNLNGHRDFPHECPLLLPHECPLLPPFFVCTHHSSRRDVAQPQTRPSASSSVPALRCIGDVVLAVEDVASMRVVWPRV